MVVKIKITFKTGEALEFEDAYEDWLRVLADWERIKLRAVAIPPIVKE